MKPIRRQLTSHPLSLRLITACITAYVTWVSVPARAEDSDSANSPVVRLVGPWELEGPLVTVWPARLSGRRGLTDLYAAMLQPLPSDLDVALVAARPPSARDMDTLSRPARYLPVPPVEDIWIGDWAGWAGVDAEGRLVRVMADHVTPRFTGRDRRRAKADQTAGEIVADRLYGRRHSVPLVITGAQLAHNGGDFALVSNRVIHQNEQKPLETIKQILRRHTGLEHILFIPVPPGTTDGEINGVVRFVSPTKLWLATAAADQDSDSAAYLRSLAHFLDDRLPDDIEVLPIPRAFGPVANPYGNYLHALQIGAQLWLPAFDRPSDNAIQRYLQEVLPDMNVNMLSSDALRDALQDGLMPDRLYTLY